MNIREILKAEHSRSSALKIAQYIGNDPNRFKELVEVFAEGPKKIMQRASWPLRIVVLENPRLVSPYLKLFLTLCNQPDAADAVRRNTMNMLQYIEIPPRFQMQVIDMAFSFLQRKREPIAVKVFSMSVIARLAANLPDLKKELRIVLEDSLPYSSPGFISRARKVLREIS